MYERWWEAHCEGSAGKERGLYYWKTTRARAPAAARRAITPIITDHPPTKASTSLRAGSPHSLALGAHAPWPQSVLLLLLLLLLPSACSPPLHPLGSHRRPSLPLLCCAALCCPALLPAQSGVGRASLHSSRARLGPATMVPDGASFHAGRRESNVIRPAPN